MTVFAGFALAALITYLLRSCMTLFGQRLTESPRMENAIRLVSPAALAAIVASSVFLDGGSIVRPVPFELVILAIAFGVVHRTGNIGAALFIGLPLYWMGSLLPI